MNNKVIHQNLCVRRVMFTVALAAGVCGAAWGQGTLSTVVQAGQGVTKIAVGEGNASTVSNGVMVQAASGTAVSIEAAPAPGKAARLKLTRIEDVDLSEHTGHVIDPGSQTGDSPANDPSSQTGESPTNDPGSQASESPTNDPSSQIGESGGGQSQQVSLISTEDNEQTNSLKTEISGSLNHLFEKMPAEDKDKLPSSLNLKETMTLKLDNYSVNSGDVTLNFLLETPFESGIEIWIVFACPTNEDTSWFTVKSVGKENGSIVMTIPATTLSQLANKTFVAFFLG